MAVTGAQDAAEGAEQGEHRARLNKTLKPSWVWAIALGSAVGWGAFVQPTDWIATAGPLGAILGFLIGGMLMILIAVSYGLLIKTFPVSGGEFAYSYASFGRRHAFVCGWFLTLGYICIVALNASALALLSRYVLPQVGKWVLLYEVAGWKVYLGEVLVASAALLLFAALNIRGSTLSGRLQFIFCVIMLLGVAAILISVLLHPGARVSNVHPLFPSGTPPVAAVLAIVAIAPWAYVGFDNVPQAAEEFNFAPKKAFRLIVFALAAAALLYAAMLLATSSAAPWQRLVAGQPIWGTGDAMSGLFGGVGIMMLAVSLSMGICTGLNGFYVSASRLLFAMGRAKMVPTGFAKLHPRWNTPYLGIVFVCAICLIAPWFGRQALQWVVDMSSVGVTIGYTYTCVVAFNQFRWLPDPHSNKEDGPRPSWGKKTLSLLGAITGVIFLGLLLVPASPAALGPESLIALGVWVALGLLFYAVRHKKTAQLSKAQLDYLILDKRS